MMGGIRMCISAGKDAAKNILGWSHIHSLRLATYLGHYLESPPSARDRVDHNNCNGIGLPAKQRKTPTDTPIHLRSLSKLLYSSALKIHPHLAGTRPRKVDFCSRELASQRDGQALQGLLA